jgi:tetratricopeptide (TPR) repeat protein
MQRGIAHHKWKDFKAALEDFEKALKSEARSAELWNFKGMCETQLGDLDAAIASFEKAVHLNPRLREAWMNKTNVEKELGRWETALQTFSATKSKFPEDALGEHYLGSQFHLLGRTRDALQRFSRCVELDPSDVGSIHMQGVCLQALGEFQRAIETFSKLLARQPAHHAWYNREICLYVWSRLDEPVTTFNMDHQIDPRFKDVSEVGDGRASQQFVPTIILWYIAGPMQENASSDARWLRAAVGAGPRGRGGPSRFPGKAAAVPAARHQDRANCTNDPAEVQRLHAERSPTPDVWAGICRDRAAAAQALARIAARHRPCLCAERVFVQCRRKSLRSPASAGLERPGGHRGALAPDVRAERLRVVDRSPSRGSVQRRLRIANPNVHRPDENH